MLVEIFLLCPEISEQRDYRREIYGFIGEKLLPGQDVLWTSNIFREERSTFYKDHGTSGRFPVAWRSRVGCVQDRGVLHVGCSVALWFEVHVGADLGSRGY